jgi:transposase-like protein
MIQEEAEKWLTRPLEKKYWALYVDGWKWRFENDPLLTV